MKLIIVIAIVAAACAGAIKLLDFADLRQIEYLSKSVSSMSNSSIVGQATFSNKLTDTEILKIQTATWHLEPLMVSGLKLRAEYKVIGSGLERVCLTVMAREPKLTFEFHGSCIQTNRQNSSGP